MSQGQTVDLPVVLGKKYKDNVSGWEGIATAAYVYMNGCIRVELSDKDKDGLPKGYVFDEAQIAELDLPPVEKKEPTRTGGSQDSTPVAR